MAVGTGLLSKLLAVGMMAVGVMAVGTGLLSKQQSEPITEHSA